MSDKFRAGQAELYWHFKFGPIDFGSDDRPKPPKPPRPIVPPPPPRPLPPGPHPLPPGPPRPPRPPRPPKPIHPDWRHPGPRPLRDGADDAWNALVEDLAQAIHESGRESVELGKTMRAVEGCEDRKFIEWEDLPEEAKEGRRIQARWFLDVCGEFDEE